MKNSMRLNYTSIICTLMILMSLAQLSLSIYFPAIPQIMAYYHIKHEKYQLLPVLYLLSFGMSHLFYGAVSDWIGRKKLLIIGMALFSTSCLVIYGSSSFSFSLISFIIMGVGAASCSALTGGVLSDIVSGKQLTSAVSTLGVFTIITPILSPIIGIFLQSWFGWKSIFL